MGKHLSRVGVSPSWLRHRILIPAFAGSTPSTPAKIQPRAHALHEPVNHLKSVLSATLLATPP
jgi:hypothetical protein